MTISAECHSDDHAVEVEFDAEAWFKTATDKEINTVAAEGWQFGYGTDAIAQAEAERNEAVAEMFTYVGIRHKVDDCGFGCSVDREEALAWLKENRPALHKSLMEEER